jgi:hypothetical protein
MKITALVAAGSSATDLPNMVSPRAFDAVDEFAAALGEAAKVTVNVIEGTLANAPTDGYVVLFDAPGLANYPEVALRSVLINSDRAMIRSDVENHNLVGAIEKHRYFLWRKKRKDETGSGLVGRKDVAPLIGARVTPGPYTTARYGWLSSDRFTDLPSLLAGYLATHQTLTS